MSDKPEKDPKEKKGFLSRTPVRRIMRHEGARLVSDEAVDLMIKTLEEIAIKTTKKAMSLVKDEKRRRLTAEDIDWASDKEGQK